MDTIKTNLKNTAEFVGIMEPEGVNLELLIATEVLDLDSLHYGYWGENQKVTLENFKIAQKRYTETLLDMIPKGVKKILDIGCGIGDNASEMTRKGYTVTAISPDKNHKKYFGGNKNKNVHFENCKLSEFDTEEMFDLFLLSESQTYFDPKVTFEKAQKNLKEGGYILISDMFNTKVSSNLNSVTHTEKQYTDEAKNYGLKQVESVDITKEILPSLELAHDVFTKYMIPMTEVGNIYLKNAAPLKHKLISIFFKKQLKDFGRILNYYGNRLDPAFFENKMRYKRVLLKKG